MTFVWVRLAERHPIKYLGANAVACLQKKNHVPRRRGRHEHSNYSLARELRVRHCYCQSIDTAPVARYMLGQRRRRWANVKPALIQSIVCNGHVLFPTWVQGFVSGILSLHLFPLQASLYFIVSL